MPIDPLLPQLHLPRMLEVHEIAYLMKCSHETVRRLIRTRQLAAHRLGQQWRVTVDDLQLFLAAQRVERAAHDGPRESTIRPVHAAVNRS